MGYPMHPIISREVAIREEVDRCASIMRAVGLELVQHRHDRDGHIVELRMGQRTTRGFGLSVLTAFANAAEEHRQ